MPPDSRPSRASALWKLLRQTFDITDNASPEATMEGIQRDIDFKGFNVWILILAIYIASIGLNVNSTAVIIGAMLISPLMGPIMGIGLSLGINDWPNLKRSFRSLSIAVVVSLITSTLYFSITPLDDAQSELLARTQPNILDVFIAFFGGLAGILAGSRKEKSNVIPGVAIATALMPPLCTAGFGLGTGQWNFFFGAFYLFLINATFISIATFLVVRYLKFPLAQWTDERTRKRTSGWLSLLTVLMIAPAVWFFYIAIQQSILDRRRQRFVQEVVVYEGTTLVRERVIRIPGSGDQLELVLLGKPVPSSELERWQGELGRYGLPQWKLSVIQNGSETDFESLSADEVFTQYLEMLRINETLEKKLSAIEQDRARKDVRPVVAELKALEPYLLEVSFARKIRARDAQVDTVEIVELQWAGNVGSRERTKRNSALSRFLAQRLGKDTVVVE
ncbi:TIGR00341 family protein [bacterium]|nr:TIGR00341 family protein [bacterium]